MSNKQFVRKINKSKWNNQLSGSEDEKKIIGADAITNCLKTTSNTLSIWNVDNIEDAVIALAATRDTIAAIDIIVFDESFFEDNDIKIKQIKANNPIKDLEDFHYDIVELEFWKLGIISEEIAINASTNKTYIQRYTASTIKRLLKDAIKSDRCEVSELHPSLIAKVS